MAYLIASRAFLRERVRVYARACAGTHPVASATGGGALALHGYGAPVATPLHLRRWLVHVRWHATELGARQAVFFHGLAVIDQPVLLLEAGT